MSTDYSILHIYTEHPDHGLYVIARFYEGDIGVTGGGAGWQSVQRPQMDPITAWRGPTDSYTMEIPLIFDVLDQKGADIEVRCRTFERMYGALEQNGGQPPLLILNANGALPNDVYNFPPLRWVISEPPTWGEQLRNDSGRRVSQVITAKFMHYVAYDEFTRTKSAAKALAPHTTIAKGGDTYNKIAARFLKNYGGVKWGNRLARFNGARDGASRPQPGQIVKLPSVTQIKDWGRTPRR
ncbi:MAG: hypothetical protein ACXVXP_00450 [Mycobacteriaceae bacterium]